MTYFGHICGADIPVCRTPQGRQECLPHGKRSGLTLIELLVVIGLIALLASLSVMFLPALGDQARAARGGQFVQGWLNTARQRALRDRAPYGLRLIIEPGTTLVKQCQYLQVDEDWPPAQGTITIEPYKTPGGPGDPHDPLVAKVNGIDLTNGSTNRIDWIVQERDYLRVLGGGLAHRLTFDPAFPTTNQVLLAMKTAKQGVFYDAASNATYLWLASPLPSFQTTKEFRITRQPRVVSDELLQLPDDVAIDLKTNDATAPYGFYSPIPPPNPPNPDGSTPDAGSIDIIFAPSGQVISSGVLSDSINLWVRDISNDDNPTNLPFDGEPTIIAIYVRTGFIAAHSPDPPPWIPPKNDPYSFVRDGMASGL